MDSCVYSPPDGNLWGNLEWMGGQVREDKESSDVSLPWMLSPNLSDGDTATQFSVQDGDSLPDLESASNMGRAIQEHPAEPKWTQSVQDGDSRMTSPCQQPAVESGVPHIPPASNADLLHTPTSEQLGSVPTGHGPSTLADQSTIDTTFAGFVTNPAQAQTNGSHFNLGHSSVASSSPVVSFIKSLPTNLEYRFRGSSFSESPQSIACTQPNDHPVADRGHFVNQDKSVGSTTSLPADLATLPVGDLVPGDVNMTHYIENLVATVTESSKNPDTLCYLEPDHPGQKTHTQEDGNVYRPSPTQTHVQYVPNGPSFMSGDLASIVTPLEPSHVFVKLEPEEEIPKPKLKRRRNRKGGLTDQELQQEIDQKKAKEAKQVVSFDPAQVKKKENRKRQNREAAERCRIKKKREEEQQKEETNLLVEKNQQMETEIEQLLKEKAQLTAILQNHQCSSVPGHILAAWREQCHTNQG